MLDAVALAKPVLPRFPCKLHEPERIDERYVRRGPVPCPECYLAAPGAPKTYVRFLKAPIAEPGKHGIGLKVTINVEAKAVYEPQWMFGRQVWRLKDVTSAKKAG